MLASAFSTTSLQAVIWTSGNEPTTNDVLRLATSNWAETFDGEPVILPVVPSLPAGVPRLTLTSSDKAWRLQMASHRLDLFWRQMSENEEPISQGDFSKWVKESVYAFLTLQESLKVVRMAFVIQRFAIQPEPAARLAEYFVRPELRAGPLNKPGDFQVHAHKAYQPASMPKVNSWIRWSTGTLSESSAAGIIVEQDINTLADQDGAYENEDVSSFFALAPNEADAILAQYLSATANSAK